MSEIPSDIPELKIPDFESTIPDQLMHSVKDEGMKWIIHEQSKQSQAIHWLCKGMVDTNSQTRRTNGRTTRLEEKAARLDREIQGISDTLSDSDRFASAVIGVFEMHKEKSRSRIMDKLKTWQGVSVLIATVVGIISTCLVILDKLPFIQ